jgi:hypothetical protein
MPCSHIVMELSDIPKLLFSIKIEVYTSSSEHAYLPETKITTYTHYTRADFQQDNLKMRLHLDLV